MHPKTMHPKTMPRKTMPRKTMRPKTMRPKTMPRKTKRPKTKRLKTKRLKTTHQKTRRTTSCSGTCSGRRHPWRARKPGRACRCWAQMGCKPARICRRGRTATCRRCRCRRCRQSPWGLPSSRCRAACPLRAGHSLYRPGRSLSPCRCCRSGCTCPSCTFR